MLGCIAASAFLAACMGVYLKMLPSGEEAEESIFAGRWDCKPYLRHHGSDVDPMGKNGQPAYHALRQGQS